MIETFEEKALRIQEEDLIDDLEYEEPKVKIRISIEVDGAEMVDQELIFSNRFDAHSRDWDKRIGDLIDEASDRFISSDTDGDYFI